jgi:hypothetical protein
MQTRRADLWFSLVIPLALVLFVLVRGDPLYSGAWYYLIATAVVVGLFYALKSPAFFISGATLALSFTYLAYWLVQFQRARPEGLLGLGHFFALPGALFGLLAARAAIKALPGIGAVWSFVLGFGGCGVGFIAAQGLVCNTVMWCGPVLSFFFRTDAKLPPI